MNKLPFTRPLAAFVLLTFCVSVGCSNVRTVGVGQVTPDEAESLVGKYVRFHTDDGVKTGTVESVDYPYVACRDKDRSRSYSSSTVDEIVRMRIDLRGVSKVEIVELARGKTVGLCLGIYMGVVLVLVAVTLILDPNAFNR